MKIRRHIVACAAFLLSLTGATAPAPPSVFKSTGPWAMEYADNGCRLIREFSDGTASLTVALERFSLEPTLRLGLTGPTVRSRRSQPEAGFRFTGLKDERTSPLFTSELADGRAAYLLSAASMLPPDPPVRDPSIYWARPKNDLPARLKTEMELARQISGIEIHRGFVQPMLIELGPMGQPIKAMQVCTEDLMKSWGLDAARIYAETRPVTPINNPATWVTPNDYPSSKLRSQEGGLVRVRLLIGADGAIGKCMIDVAEKGDFEEVVCNNLARRAKFAPALDADGKPAPSYWVGSWRFST